MKLFISYPRKDREETDHLIALLKKAGHEVWIDDALIVGEDWEKQLHDAISEADALVLALTSNWVASPYCQWEFVTGVELGKGIIPVMLLQTDLPARIQKIQYADFTDGFDDEDHNEKFLNDLHTLSQKLAKNSDDEQARNQATVKIQQQIKQSNKQEVTFGDVSGGTVTVNQQNVAQQNNTYGEKQRNWTIPVVLGLIIALITLFVTVFPSATESFLDNFAQPTAIAGEPFQEDVVGIVLADFSDLDEGAREVERRIEREFEEAEIPFIRVRHEIADREEAQRIADLYNATITIWGESAEAWIEVFYEITPRSENEVETKIEASLVSADLENFRTYILEGMDSLYVVNFTIGQLEYYEQDYTNALDFFNQAISAIPLGREEDLETEVLYYHRGATHRSLGETELAIADYTRAIEIDENYVKAYNNRGVSYRSLGETELAIADYTRAIEIDENYVISYVNRGVVHYGLGEYELAIADYTRAIELDDDYVVTAYINRGNIYRALGEYELAIDDYDRAIELDEGDFSIYAFVGRGFTHRSIGETELAIADYTRAIEIDDQSIFAYINRGTVYSDLGEYELAIADYTRAIEIDNEYVLAYISRGTVYSDLGEYELAVADYTRVIELDDTYISAYINRGVSYRSIGETELAIADYSHVIELDDTYTSAYINRGTAYYDLGEYELAIADYDRAIELDENYGNAHYSRGTIHSSLGEYELAIADYSHAIELDDDNALAYISRGTVYSDLGEYELAIADYDRVIELDPEYASAYYGRGVAYHNLGEYELAIADYDRAIELDPEFTFAYWGRGNANYDRGIDYYADAIADYRQYEQLTGALEPFMVERIAEMETALADNQ